MRQKNRVYFQNGGLSAGTLRTKLRQFGYRTRAPSGVDLRFTYYDTQDGRLHRCRARLRCCTDPDGLRGWWLIEQEDAALEWICPAGHPPAEGRFTGAGNTGHSPAEGLYRGIRPAQMACPEGEPFGDKLGELAAGKPLFPVLRALVTGDRFGVTAPDGGEAVLSFQRWVFYPPFKGDHGEQGCSNPFDFIELAVKPAEGKPGTGGSEFAYLTILLRDIMGLSPAEPDPLVLGLESLSRPLPGAPVPAMYTPTRGDSMPSAIGKVVGGQAYRMRANTEGTVLDLDTEFLHDLRVATRRARFSLKYARLVADRARCDALREELAWVSGALGPVRDLDVFLQSLEEQFERAEAFESTRKEICTFLAERRARAFGELEKALRSDRYGAVLEALGAFRTLEDGARPASTSATPETFSATPGAAPSTPEAVPATPGPPAERKNGPAAAETAPRLIRKALKRVKKIGRGHSAESKTSHTASRSSEFSPAALHELRIAFKGLRYTCEYFLPLFGEEMREAIKMTVMFQDCLGRYQDARSAAELLRSLLREKSNAEPRVGAETLVTLGALIQLQRDSALAERERFSGLWGSFSQLAKRLRALVKG